MEQKAKRLVAIVFIPVAFCTLVLIVPWLGKNCDAKTTAQCLEYWFNRYQTLVGIGGAIFAAWLTARPVWTQLEEMRGQSAVQIYELHHRTQQIVEETTRVASQAEAESMHSLITEQSIASDPTYLACDVQIILDQFKERCDSLVLLQNNLEISATKRWGGADVRHAHRSLIAAVAALIHDFSKARADLHHFRIEYFSSPEQIRSHEVGFLRAFTVKPKADEVGALARNLYAISIDELRRLAPLLERAAARAEKLIQ